MNVYSDYLSDYNQNSVKMSSIHETLRLRREAKLQKQPVTQLETAGPEAKAGSSRNGRSRPVDTVSPLKDFAQLSLGPPAITKKAPSVSPSVKSSKSVLEFLEERRARRTGATNVPPESVTSGRSEATMASIHDEIMRNRAENQDLKRIIQGMSQQMASLTESLKSKDSST